jgi:hypothetical protein
VLVLVEKGHRASYMAQWRLFALSLYTSDDNTGVCHGLKICSLNGIIWCKVNFDQVLHAPAGWLRVIERIQNVRR